MKSLGAAFHDVQFQTEVRRAQPLALSSPGSAARTCFRGSFVRCAA
jgi:hypothetical protein